MNYYMIRGGIAASCLMLLILLFVACDLETSDNGKLDGYWHLESVDTLGGGSRDLSRSRMFWAFQKDLLLLTDRDFVHPQCLMRFRQGEGVLKLTEPYLYDRESSEGDRPLLVPDLLIPFGVNSVSETFSVERLTGSRMVLCTDRLRLAFTKF